MLYNYTPVLPVNVSRPYFVTKPQGACKNIWSGDEAMCTIFFNEATGRTQTFGLGTKLCVPSLSLSQKFHCTMQPKVLWQQKLAGFLHNVLTGWFSQLTTTLSSLNIGKFLLSSIIWFPGIVASKQLVNTVSWDTVYSHMLLSAFLVISTYLFVCGHCVDLHEVVCLSGGALTRTGTAMFSFLHTHKASAQPLPTRARKRVWCSERLFLSHGVG